jgi:hypothetical protein
MAACHALTPTTVSGKQQLLQLLLVVDAESAVLTGVCAMCCCSCLQQSATNHLCFMHVCGLFFALLRSLQKALAVI